MTGYAVQSNNKLLYCYSNEMLYMYSFFIYVNYNMLIFIRTIGCNSLNIITIFDLICCDF